MIGVSELAGRIRRFGAPFRDAPFRAAVRAARDASAVLLWVAALGCASDRSATQVVDPAAEGGTVQFALRSTVNMTTYRLRNAVFQVEGPRSLMLAGDATLDDELLTQNLPAGIYQITLLTGWVLEKETPEGYLAVEATLVSEPVRSIAIAAGRSTTVRYRFRTNGVVVELGDGLLNIGIEVEESGDSDASLDGDGGCRLARPSSDASMDPCDGCPDGALLCGGQCVSSCGGRLRVRAFIDGRSQLLVRANRVWWRHFEFAAPGLHDPFREPTELWHQASGAPEFYASWCPSWPNGCNTCEGTCGELRDLQGLESVAFEALSPLLPAAGRLTSLALDLAESRGLTAVVQEPATANDYTLIIEFDDNAFGGAVYYDVSLAYTFSPDVN